MLVVLKKILVDILFGTKKHIQYKGELLPLTDISFDDTIFMSNMQSEIDMLSKRVHDIEKFLKYKPEDCVEPYKPSTKLFWSIESGSIMSRAEWDKDDSCDRLEYIGTAKENGYEFKSQCDIIDSQHDDEILKCNHSSALDDVIMECFLFHKESRRSRI
jgi:hypothetical protein